MVPFVPVHERLRRHSQRDPATGCVVWTGVARENNGLRYGRMMVAGRNLAVHRIAYELVRGVIPPGLQIDHLCRNTLCVNPDHLEPVTGLENNRRGNGFGGQNARKTHCKRGHPFDAANTLLTKKGRNCRECRGIHDRASKARRRARRAVQS